MTWLAYLLLFTLLTLVAVAPLWPAWQEWRHPTDDQPLHIGQHDALDPPYLAKSFSKKLAKALATKSTHLGEYELAMAPKNGPWRLSATENRKERSKLLWHSPGDLTLPQGLRLLAPVASRRNLCTASDGTYHSLWAGRHMRLWEGSTVQRWAHARVVDVHADCQLQGRVTADERIHVIGDCTFTLLHAPLIEFGSPCERPDSGGHASPLPGLPPQAKVDEKTERALCHESLVIEAHRSWSSDLVCKGDLDLGIGCVASGSIKAHGTLTLAAQCQVSGNLVAVKAILVGAGCTVQGSVVSETAIVLSAGCVVGSPGRPATVAAPFIDIADGVTVHGTVWAEKQGSALQAFEGHAEVAPTASATTNAPSSVVALRPRPSSDEAQAA